MGFLKSWATVLAITLLSPLQIVEAAPTSATKELALARDYVLAACLVERYHASALEAEAQTWAAD